MAAEELYTNKKVTENMRMLQRVMVKFIEEKDDSNDDKTYLDRAAKYTGLQRNVLLGLKNCQLYKLDFEEIDRGVIYDELAFFYLELSLIPATRQLFDALYKKIPPYVDIRSFRKTLVNMGFMWKRFGNKGASCGVIERPTIIFERYEYLKYIIHYRNVGKHIYFIDENALSSTREYLTQKQSDALNLTDPQTSQRRLIYAVSKTAVHCVKFIDDFNEDTFLKWLEYDLLLNIEDSSVVVLNKSKHHNGQIIEPPNKESLKIEICNWLNYHNIPFEDDMSKYELLNLTERFTNVDENMYKIDRIIRENGHAVLRIPDCIKKLTPANLICNFIKAHKEIFITDDMNEDGFAEALGSISRQKFEENDGYILEREKTIFAKDVNIDKFFDDLVDRMNVSNHSLVDYDTEIPSCSDSE